MKNLKIKLLVLFITILNIVSAQPPKGNLKILLSKSVKTARLKPILLNYYIRQKKEESTTVPSTDCPDASVTCTTVRANLESPIFGSSIFTVPNDLFVGNIFDVTDYKDNGTLTPKLLGARKNITVSASTQSVGGTESESIVPTKTEYMSFITRARSSLDTLIGSNRPIESIEYNLESITSEAQMKATLGTNYRNPQNYFDFQSSVSASNSKQYAVLKFIEKSFEVSMDDPTDGFYQTPTSVNSSYGFVSSVTYGRFALLIFETDRNDFNLKTTLEGGINVPAVSEAGIVASAALSTVQNKIKVRLVMQGFNANESYASLLSAPVTLDNTIVDKINKIIGGAIGYRVAAVPIVITAKKTNIENDSYPEITQKVTFNNVPIDKNCITNFPPSKNTYRYKVTFHKIYSTDDAWGSSEQLYGSLRCNMVSASKEESTKRTYNLASISQPNQFELKEKKKSYNLNELINGLQSYTAIYTKPECITEDDFLTKSYVEVTAPLYIDRNPFDDQIFDRSRRYKRHYLKDITGKIGPNNDFGNTCNSANQGIICATTPDGQNFQISYSIEKVN
jgi:hypothetical protein